MDAHTVVIVDPYYSHLVDTLRKQGNKVIAVFSEYVPSREVISYYPMDSSQFCESYTIKNDWQLLNLVQHLRKNGVEDVLNGFDTGTSLWLRICHQLKQPYHPPLYLSEKLRNKSSVNHFLGVRGVGVPLSVQVTEKNYREKARYQHLGLPVVVKPTESANGHGFNICDTWGEVNGALLQTLGFADIYGVTVDEMVVEEFLDGTEYNVSIACIHGHIKVVGLWEYDAYMIDGVRFHRALRVMSHKEPEAKVIMAYAENVVDALSFYQGAIGVEMILTKDGPKLVEINPRVCGLGGLLDDVLMQCTGHSHIDAAERCAGHDKSRAHAIPPILNPEKSGRVVLLRNYSSCMAETMKPLLEIQALETVLRVKSSVKLGQHVPRTIDCNNNPGVIAMVGSEEDIDRDLKVIERIEKSGLFSINRK